MANRHQYRYRHFRAFRMNHRRTIKLARQLTGASRARAFSGRVGDAKGARESKKKRTEFIVPSLVSSPLFNSLLPHGLGLLSLIFTSSPPSCRSLRPFILRYRSPIVSRPNGANSDVCPARIFIRSGALTKHNQPDYLPFYLPIVYSTRNSRGERGRGTQTHRVRVREREREGARTVFDKSRNRFATRSTLRRRVSFPSLPSFDKFQIRSAAMLFPIKPV